MSQEDSYLIIKEILGSQHPEDVKELGLLVSEKLGVDEKEALDIVLSLEGEGKLSFYNKNGDTFLNYIGDISAAWFWAYSVITFLSALSVIFISQPNHPLIYVRHALGVLYVVLLPGYALVKILYPSNQINIVIRLALSITLSLVVVPSIGYFLNFMPWGIGLVPVNIGILLFSITCSIIGLYREYQGRRSAKALVD